MQFNSDSEISHIANGLINRTLPRSEWTHAAHWAAAVWLMHNDQHDPFKEMPDFIRAYNEATGTPNTDSEGYHETITIASLRATKYAIKTSPADQPLYETVNKILASDLGQPGWLFKYWSKDRLFSVHARKNWTEPDLAPLSFE